MNYIDVMPGSDGVTSGVDEYEKDGLVYCSKCDTPKQMRLEIDGVPRIVSHVCECEAERLDAEEAAHKERQRRDRAEAWRGLGIENARWRTHKFTGEEGKAYKYAINFEIMLDANYGLLLYGEVGSGKTYQAASIANYLTDKGRMVLMATISELTSKINEDFGENRDMWMRRIAQADLMILDDFGAERRTEYGNEQAYTIIDARYRSNKPLVVTTNLTLEEMGAEPDVARKRINDRIREMCVPIKIDGDSRRKEIAKAMRAEAERLLE